MKYKNFLLQAVNLLLILRVLSADDLHIMMQFRLQFTVQLMMLIL